MDNSEGKFSDFAKSAKELSKNPLGIIALFIVLVYGFACLLFTVSAATLQSIERLPLIWFVVLFPILVLVLFGWLVSTHHNKLYAPSDYRDDNSFLATIQHQQIKNQNVDIDEKTLNELMEYGKDYEIVKEQEKRIEDDLNNRKIDCSGNVNKVLIRQLAVAQVVTWFEKTYNTIFGSQILFLKKINEAQNGFDYDYIVNEIKSHYKST